MANKLIFTIFVALDTPDGVVFKRYVRNSWHKVINLLSSFDCLPLDVVINTSNKYVR